MDTSARYLPLLFLSMGAFASSLPQVDFDRMGTVGLAGAFSGLDFIQNTTFTFDPSSSTILQRSQTGALTPLASTNSGGRITTGCTLGDTVYVAGSFSSIGDQQVSNVASYTPKSGAFSGLASGGPNGEVDAIYCDSKENKIWVGGNFTSPGTAVAVWDLKTKAWSKPPFSGFAGSQPRVSSITTNSSDASLFFAGSFLTSFTGPGGPIINGTNNPNVPYSAGATPFSSSLVPIPLSNAEVEGSPSSTNSQFSNIKNILCPSGADGPGNTWLAADNNQALVTIRTFTFISANGVRLGNTFQANHGTTAFSVTTIPDNKVQTMHYRDPTTGQTQTCTDSCPLSTDSSLLYQDFLFDSSLDITGVQIKLAQFTGSSAGLHILQLLSSGAFASAVEDNNGESCFAPSASNTTRTGDWVVKVANTDIAGTIQSVLVSDIKVGTSSSAAPSLTWQPYVSASGNYEVNLLVPGCTALQDCEKRTSVKVTVFPGEGLSPQISTISQRTNDDTSVNIYTGPIVPSTPAFTTTVTLTLADNPTGSGQNGQYEIVADRVQLILKSASNDTSDSSGMASGANGNRTSFGFFEFVRNGPNADATQILPNTTITYLDQIGFGLFNGSGGTNGLAFADPSSVSAVAHHPSGAIYLGGSFSLSSGTATGTSNLVAFKDGALSRVSSNGLNGPVNALFLVGNNLYVGGAFTDNPSGGTNGMLRGIAVYDISKDAWSLLGGGLDGAVSAINLQGSQLQLAGNFTKTFTSASDAVGLPAGGFATWDLSANEWVNSGGFLVGKLAMITNSTSSSTLIAGNINASRKYGASGMVLLKNGDSDEPQVSPLGLQLSPENSSATTTSSLVTRSHLHSRRAFGWLSHINTSLFARQASSQLAPLPSTVPTTAPAVLAGTFWQNGTTDLVIIGGNFTFHSANSSTPFEAVAIYNPADNTMNGLNGPQVNGTVLALFVDGNQLYIGGAFTIAGKGANGFAIYDLASGSWASDSFQPLSNTNGSPVTVRSISQPSSNQNAIVIAGSFSQVGSLSCQSICGYDLSSKQWNPLGNGIKGEVSSVNYAGTNQEVLIASGSIALSDNTASNVAQYTFSNATWAPIGDTDKLPGPVTALEVNDRNQSSIFVAGRSSSDSTPFLAFWNGVTWSNLDSVLHANTSVTQLTMVPLQDTHTGNDIIQSDRMLLISGFLSDPTFGSASSALFDGSSLIPYIRTTDSAGASGTIASLFRSLATFSFNKRHFLATGVVILISIAIAAGVVFLIALIGILWSLFSRRDEKLNKFAAQEEDDDDSLHHRPSSLLEHINAATRSTILGAGALGASAEKEEDRAGDKQDPFGPDASNYLRAETPLDAAGGLMAEEMSRPAHARYSFDGAGEGELPISAGAELEVLDDRDPAWWYARDVRTGQEGVVPAAYLY